MKQALPHEGDSHRRLLSVQQVVVSGISRK